MPDGDITPAPHSGLAISDSAAARIGAMLAMEAGGTDQMFRVTVSGGGCSGFQYGFGFDETRNSDDVVFEQDGITVLVDEVSLQFLEGAVLEYKEELIGSYFVLENPNASSTCGCGTSFAI